MTRIIRILILGAVAVLLVVLGRDKVIGTFRGQVSPAHSQPVVLQNTPTPVPTPLPTSTPEALVPVTGLASVQGLVWNDLNRNGLRELDEPLMDKITVNLMSAARSVVATTITGPKGGYRFQNVPPGDYYITLVPPPSFVYSLLNQGVNELVDSDTDPVLGETMPVTLIGGENGLAWTTGIYDPAAPARRKTGSVMTPATSIDACRAGVYPLGGVAVLRVNRLAPDYCLRAFLWDHAFSVGRIPDGVGRVVAPVMFLEVFYRGLFTYQYIVPGQTDSILVCMAMPVTVNQAQIYFLDFYGPRFGQGTGQPVWQPLATTVQNRVACAVSETSGAYALIGQ